MAVGRGDSSITSTQWVAERMLLLNMKGAAPDNMSVVLGLGNPVLECQVGNEKIQASVMGNCFTSHSCKMELKIFTVAISRMCWQKSDK